MHHVVKKAGPKPQRPQRGSVEEIHRGEQKIKASHHAGNLPKDQKRKIKIRQEKKFGSAELKEDRRVKNWLSLKLLQVQSLYRILV